MKKVPTTPLAWRIGRIYGRKPTTAWSEKEQKAFKDCYLSKCFNSFADVELLERFYIAERKRGSDGHQRRDLLTLLNNWPGEMDKARLWLERQPRPRSKIIPMPLASGNLPQLSDSEIRESGKFMAEYQAYKARRQKPLDSSEAQG